MVRPVIAPPLLFLLAVAPPAPPAADPVPSTVRLLILDVAHGEEVSASEASAIGAALGEAVRGPPNLEVLTGGDVRRLLELEATKMKAGCDDSCLAEIAGAMGARYVLSAQLSRLSELHVLQLTLFDADEVRAVSRTSIREEGARALLEAVPAGLAPVNAALGGAPPEVTVVEERPFPLLAASLLGAGGLVSAAAVGAGLYFNAVLLDGGRSAADKQQAQSLGRWSVLGAGVAGAALLTTGGALLLLWGIE